MTTTTLHGWEPVPAIPGGHEGVLRCTVALCGALVREDREDRERTKAHDREFHLLRAERGGPNGGYDLMLDGERIGYVYENVVRYNLRRVSVSRNWQAVLAGQRSFDAGEMFHDAMVVIGGVIPGAKAWGRGANPKVLYPVEGPAMSTGAKRVRMEKVWRGHARIWLDDVLVGDVRQRPGMGWRAEPVLAERSEHACVEEEQGGYSGSRLDAARWLFDWQGLPLSIAETLMHGWEVEPEQEPWIDQFLATMRAVS